MECWNGHVWEHLVMEGVHMVVSTAAFSLHILNPFLNIIRVLIKPNPINDKCRSSQGNNAEPGNDTYD